MAQVQGKIVQCIGAVVDVEFPRDRMPKVYDALKLAPSDTNKLVEQGLTEQEARQEASRCLRCDQPRD